MFLPFKNEESANAMLFSGVKRRLVEAQNDKPNKKNCLIKQNQPPFSQNLSLYDQSELALAGLSLDTDKILAITFMWGAEVFSEFKLSMEGYFVANTLFYRVLQNKETNFASSNLQMYYCVCMRLGISLTNRFAEPDFAVSELVFISDNTYTEKQVCACERDVSDRILNWELYAIKDLYRHYNESPFLQKDDPKKHYQFSVTLTVMMCDWRHATFPPEVLLSCCHEVCFGQKSELDITEHPIKLRETCLKWAKGFEKLSFTLPRELPDDDVQLDLTTIGLTENKVFELIKANQPDKEAMLNVFNF